jgi:hypothetical protein
MTRIGQREWATTCIATAPTLARLSTPCPIAPMTMRAAVREASTRAWLA